MVLKTCSRCDSAKELSCFSRNKNTKGGLQGQCKECNTAYYKANAERIIARVMAATDPEAAKTKAKAWYEANKERAKASQAHWRAANKEVKALSTAEWTRLNRDKVAVSAKRWMAANKEYGNAKTREYRARKRGADGRHTAQDVRALLVIQRCRCAVCRGDIAEGFHVDHIMPLVLGGSNDKANIQLLCSSCNTSKGGKHPVGFMQRRGFLI